MSRAGGNEAGNSAVPIHPPFVFSGETASLGASPRKVESGVIPGAPCVSAAGDHPANAGAPKPSIMTAAGTTTRTQSKTAAASSSGEKQPHKTPPVPNGYDKGEGPERGPPDQNGKKGNNAGVIFRTHPSQLMAMTMGITATKTQRMCSGERIAS